MFIDALEEFRLDWVLAGKAASSVDCYLRLLKDFAEFTSEASLDDARSWVGAHPSPSMRRKRAQALRAFGKWSSHIGDDDFPWWQHVPIPVEMEAPQLTADPKDFSAAMTTLKTKRDRALLSVLWGCGLRRAEAARLTSADINILEGFLTVRQTKSGHPRVVPMPPDTQRRLRQHLRHWPNEKVFGLTANGITLLLRRKRLLPAHAWRRGWTVQSLRAGVSEASVRSAAGWTSGAMVARYTRARSSDLALSEFRRTWLDSAD